MPVRCLLAIVFLLRFGFLPLPFVEDDGRLSKRHRYLQKILGTTFEKRPVVCVVA